MAKFLTVTDWRRDRIASAHQGDNPTVMAKMPEAFAVIGDVQWLPGYSVLLTDDPAVTRLSDLPRERRAAYLRSLDVLAEAVELACHAADPGFLRVNIEILGNADPFLHTHVWPRYAWEPTDVVAKPVWLYPPGNWSDPSLALDAAHDDLRREITHNISTLL